MLNLFYLRQEVSLKTSGKLVLDYRFLILQDFIWEQNRISSILDLI